MNPNDAQLEQALAKMLPENCGYIPNPSGGIWRNNYPQGKVINTELLHLVQLARKVKGIKSNLSCDATWQEQVKERVDKCKHGVLKSSNCHGCDEESEQGMKDMGFKPTPQPTIDEVIIRAYAIGHELGWEHVDLANVNSLIREASGVAAELQKELEYEKRIKVTAVWLKLVAQDKLDEYKEVVGELVEALQFVKDFQTQNCDGQIRWRTHLEAIAGDVRVKNVLMAEKALIRAQELLKKEGK